jgi:hypothetical protein
MPPHERTWRHPSELAAEEHAAARSEAASGISRLFAITTGSIGLLAVGMLMLAVTPGRSVAPIAISATTTPVTNGPVALRGRAEALATPIGEGRYALVTAIDLADDQGGDPAGARVGSAVDVSVPGGRRHEARVVGRVGDTVVVELDVPEPGPRIAEDQPASHEVVTVLAEPPVTVVLDDLDSLDVAEGTAVLDDEGDLVGLCSGHEDGTRLLTVSDALVDATNGG